MNGIAESILKRGNFGGDIAARGAGILPRHCHERGKSAVDIDSQNRSVHAHMALAELALPAFSAYDMRFARHKIADTSFGYAFPKSDNRATKLMADDSGWLDAGRRPSIPLINVQIGSAYAGGFELNKDFARSNRRFRRINELDSWFGPDLGNCFHGQKVYQSKQPGGRGYAD